jgi:hypothetical protein
MKLVSETKSIEKLAVVREEFRSEIGRFETRAKSCGSCETPGACCLDAHFVNVRITRLEAAAISRVISQLPDETRMRIETRARLAISAFGLESGADKTYACPLYESGTGCVVHMDAKPLACIAHACYENANDLPPDEVLEAAERKIARLNRHAYRSDGLLMSIPVALANAEIEPPN